MAEQLAELNKSSLINELLMPDLSTYTTPPIFSSRVNNVTGGYKRIGNIIFINVYCKTAVEMALGSWTLFTGVPYTSSHKNPLVAANGYGAVAFISEDGSLVFQPIRTTNVGQVITICGHYYVG